MRKYLIYTLLLLHTASCSMDSKSNFENKTQVENKINQDSTIIIETVKEIIPRVSTDIEYEYDFGVILDSVTIVFNSEFEKIDSLSNTYGLIVKIDSVSDLRHSLNPSDDRCDLHNYVHVSSEKFKGWVYGKSLFKKTTERDVEYTFDNSSIKIIPCHNFGIGAYDEELGELSFCGSGSQSPVIIDNNGNKSIVIIQHEQFIEDYWTLDAHDGWYDTITEAKLNGMELAIKITREYQEGVQDFEISITLTDIPTAEVIYISETRYEY
jgi:hypothetical protein